MLWQRCHVCTLCAFLLVVFSNDRRQVLIFPLPSYARGTYDPPMAADAQLTPMMAQYRRIKSELPKDALLLFRLGDFYELFFEDAQVGAQLLNVALTARNGVPMCGLPFHAANNYIARILKAGRKVAICDQME